MPNRKSLLVALLVIAVLIVAPACKKKQAADTTPEPEPQAAQPVEPPPEPVKQVEDDFPGEEVVEVVELDIDELNRQQVLKTVYFAFDKYDVDDAGRAILKRNAQWLDDNAKAGVVIEGNCDERGTIEYNLALGEKRAAAVRAYMVSLGVAASRVRIISFGEEFPADAGHGEAAWAKNRRAQSKVE